jgi:hypothetical protein
MLLSRLRQLEVATLGTKNCREGQHRSYHTTKVAFNSQRRERRFLGAAGMS